MKVKALSIVAILLIAVSLCATPIKIQGYPFEKTVTKDLGTRIESFKYTGSKGREAFVQIPNLFDTPDNFVELSSEKDKKTGLLTKKYYLEKHDGTPGALEFDMNGKQQITRLIVSFFYDTISGTYKYDGGDSMMSCSIALKGDSFVGSFWLETALGATGTEYFSGTYDEDLIMYDADYGRVGKIEDGYISVTFPDGTTVRATKQ